MLHNIFIVLLSNESQRLMINDYNLVPKKYKFRDLNS